jgi:hypothetical protein
MYGGINNIKHRYKDKNCKIYNRQGNYWLTQNRGIRTCRYFPKKERYPEFYKNPNFRKYIEPELTTEQLAEALGEEPYEEQYMEPELTTEQLAEALGEEPYEEQYMEPELTTEQLEEALGEEPYIKPNNKRIKKNIRIPKNIKIINKNGKGIIKEIPSIFNRYPNIIIYNKFVPPSFGTQYFPSQVPIQIPGENIIQQLQKPLNQPSPPPGPMNIPKPPGPPSPPKPLGPPKPPPQLTPEIIIPKSANFQEALKQRTEQVAAGRYKILSNLIAKNINDIANIKMSDMKQKEKDKEITGKENEIEEYTKELRDELNFTPEQIQNEIDNALEILKNKILQSTLSEEELFKKQQEVFLRKNKPKKFEVQTLTKGELKELEEQAERKAKELKQQGSGYYDDYDGYDDYYDFGDLPNIYF